MKVRTINWPTYGDKSVFRRAMAMYACGSAALIGFIAAGASLALPSIADVAIPFAVAAFVFTLFPAHNRAQARSRSVEIVKSFANFTVIRRGQAVRLDSSPLLGEFDTRAAATRAALASGRSAVIVRAYDHYYLLGGKVTRSMGAVAFRTKAAVDIVPATELDLSA